MVLERINYKYAVPTALHRHQPRKHLTALTGFPTLADMRSKLTPDSQFAPIICLAGKLS